MRLEFLSHAKFCFIWFINLVSFPQHDIVNLFNSMLWNSISNSVHNLNLFFSNSPALKQQVAPNTLLSSTCPQTDWKVETSWRDWRNFKLQTGAREGESRAEDHPPTTLHLCGHLRLSKDLKSSALSSYNTDLWEELAVDVRALRGRRNEQRNSERAARMPAQLHIDHRVSRSHLR